MKNCEKYIIKIDTHERAGQTYIHIHIERKKERERNDQIAIKLKPRINGKGSEFFQSDIKY